jgi:hypothetical protein
MTATILGIVNIVAVAVVLLIGVFSAINGMSRSTRHGIRASWILMTLGAGGVLLGNLPWASAVLHAGIALHIIFDQRRPPTLHVERPLFRNLPKKVDQ